MTIRITSYNFFSVSSAPDAEWKRIIHVLWVKYGVRSTGNKSLDRQKLRELELKEIKEKIKEENIKNNPKDYANQHGAQILGEQILMAIKMKKEEEDRENKKKRDNKYQN